MALTNISSIVFIDLDALATLVAAKLVPSSPPVVTPPVNTPSGNPGQVYVGKFLWPGDWSFQAAPNYTDKDPQGNTCMSFTTTGPWGGWLPYAPNQDLNITPYTSLQFDVQSTVAGQNLQLQFDAAGDTPNGVAVVVQGSSPGTWATVTIPLYKFKLTTKDILKFSIQDETGKTGVKTYLRNVSFV